ncbi:cytidylyltransferase domain-containing protein [Methanofervidicoccus sp. A16]|uniref:cytidylyltransferase domain-containing protein n=1 Tax=Methanofervidicoccus sp. A16 TaxID=2607662 RepID=UPI001C0EACA3|nr:glycosyltransferase family protein [Methanofervidicoccus sp. A16]
MIGIIIQARTSSTRLPMKVLLPLPYNSKTTVLEQVIKRCKVSKLADEVIVATTTKPEDERIVDIATKMNVGIFRGSEKDVLSRYYHTAKEFSVDVIVRITSDCPCIDPNVIDMVIKKYIDNNVDYVSNTLENTFPRGQDVEVFSFECLKEAYFNATRTFEREHVTPYIYKNPNSRYRLMNIRAPSHLTDPTIRITLDTEEDYALLCSVYDYLYTKNELFGLEDIIRLFKEKPWLKLINKKIQQKKIYISEKEEVIDAIKILELQDLKTAANILRKYLNQGE